MSGADVSPPRRLTAAECGGRPRTSRADSLKRTNVLPQVDLQTNCRAGAGRGLNQRRSKPRVLKGSERVVSGRQPRRPDATSGELHEPTAADWCGRLAGAQFNLQRYLRRGRIVGTVPEHVYHNVIEDHQSRGRTERARLEFSGPAVRRAGRAAGGVRRCRGPAGPWPP